MSADIERRLRRLEATDLARGRPSDEALHAARHRTGQVAFAKLEAMLAGADVEAALLAIGSTPEQRVRDAALLATCPVDVDAVARFKHRIERLAEEMARAPDGAR